jgi:glycosyltransferase involved in cell wall biosynthesis
MQKNKKIFFYVDTFDFSKENSGSGGASSNNAVIRHMADEAIFVGYTSQKDSFGKVNTTELFQNRISYIPLADYSHSGYKSLLLPGAIRFLFYLFKYKKIYNDFKINNVFTGNYIVLWFFAFFTNMKIIYYATGLGNPWTIGRHKILGKFFSPFYYFFQVRALRHVVAAWAADSVEECTKWNKLLSKKNISTQFHSIPSVVDTDFFSPEDHNTFRKDYLISESMPVYIFVGRLAYIKGIDLILRSFHIVIQSIPNAILLIVGDGEERGKLLELSNQLSLGDHVRFLGNKSREDVKKLLNCSDVALVASFVEGSSFSMIEQLATGKAIVSTPVNGAESIIFEGINGFIVKERDPMVYSKKMIDALSLIDAQSFSRNLALQSYSEKKCWAELKKQILGTFSE